MQRMTHFFLFCPRVVIFVPRVIYLSSGFSLVAMTLEGVKKKKHETNGIEVFFSLDLACWYQPLSTPDRKYKSQC